MPAQTTAKIVIASAKRLIELRHVCLNSSRIAEISVPAWPIPIHHTKLMMAKPQRDRDGHAPDADALQEQPGQRDDQQHRNAAGDQKAEEPAQRACATSARCRRIFCVTDLKLCPGAMTAILAGPRVDHRIDYRIDLVWSPCCADL